MASLSAWQPKLVEQFFQGDVQKDDMNWQLSLPKLVLRRNSRIQGQDNIAAIIKKGDEHIGGTFVMRSLQTERGYNRYGIVISKKLDKSAVRRNRKRRQIYEIIRLAEKDKTVPKELSRDIVLLARRSVMKLEFDDLKKAVLNALANLKK